MPRSPEEMPALCLEYTTVVRNLECSEMTETGEDRETLGVVALGVAGFLRKQPWRDEAERQAGFSLAARADEVARKCAASPRPRAQA